MSAELFYTTASLLIIGMTTVFFVLFLVVMSSKILIHITNSYSSAHSKSDHTPIPNEELHAKIIKKAINSWSEGKAVVANISKY